jgi:glucokinase
MLLSGDIGGTNARLGLFTRGTTRPELARTSVYPTSDYPDMEAMLYAFMRDSGLAASDVEGAAFGVAGPVLDNVVSLTNANWQIDGARTAQALHLPRVRLVNDLTAMAWGVTVLTPGEYVTLQEGRKDPRGNVVVIAPGTGLGESLLHNEDGRLMPSPSEGGHADFAARTPREIDVLIAVTARCGRVSNEHLLSGQGLVNLFRVTHANGQACAVDPDLPDAPARITTNALASSCPACVEVLDLFVSILGAEAGNLAVRGVATGGVFVGGGIPPRVLPALRDGRFMRAFLAKEPAGELVGRIPVHVITHPYPGLLGAAVLAN